MLLNGIVPVNEIKSSKDDLVSLDKFLEENKTNSENEPWCKLDKTIKTKKLIVFSEKYLVQALNNSICPYFPPLDSLIENNFSDAEKPVIIQIELANEREKKL